jgi:hypothetical protein
MYTCIYAGYLLCLFEGEDANMPRISFMNLSKSLETKFWKRKENSPLYMKISCMSLSVPSYVAGGIEASSG